VRSESSAVKQDREDIVVELRDVSAGYGERVVARGLNLKVHRGELLAIVGGSGSGKSTLLKLMLLLSEPLAGRLRLFGRDTRSLSEAARVSLHRRMGTLFQYSALFGALTVAENIAIPLEEHTDLEQPQMAEIARLKVALVGLPAQTAARYPNELSGGMRKRAGLARALALDPELLLLDEPHSGLDPLSADALDGLIEQLKASLDLTIVMVTHDMDSCWRIADRVALLGDGRLLAVAPMSELAESEDPAVRIFFEGPRAARPVSG
jgi:phospholipid/cholesterol/gamma-HCH transport system ATP-binding protein